MYSPYGGFLSQVDRFEPQFFGVSPREAVSLDPQQRLLLEVSWEALERANQVPEKLFNSSTGVFVGIGSHDYVNVLRDAGDLASIDAYFGTGNAFSVAAGRLSYTLGLTGPCLAVDTACSSSLVTVHLACQSLRNRECNLALAGGVNLILSADLTINFCKARMLSPDGRCKSFDASADGYVRGEGCGMIVLKRLSDAVADQDNILALVRGSAVNQDGPSGGLTVPNGPSQEALIRQALKNSGVEPSQVSYIEAHGTGTSLGDPIEVEALGAVFGKNRPTNRPLAIGSVKTNIGHLESAAGVAGLIKVILALQKQEIPPHLHFKQPNPHISWDRLPIEVASERIPWLRGEMRRIAGVSSFGFSGTNAHIVLEEAPVAEPVQSSVERPAHLLTISAKTPEALKQLAARYENHLVANPPLALGDVCFNANTGRSHFQHRLSVVASSSTELVDKLAAFNAGQAVSGVSAGHRPTSEPPKIAFLFSGQGAQYLGMGRQLYETQPTFRAALDKCAEILQPYLETPLLEVLYPTQASENLPSKSKIDETAYTQPALFALEYALAQLWQSWGIKPDVVMGHSVGEYVAATIAGVFSLEDGLKLIAHRGQLMQALPRIGEMVAVMADEATVREAIAPYSEKVAIAAINGPNSIVISGETEAIQQIVFGLTAHAIETKQLAEGIKTKQLQVSHAFHSPLMEPMLESFEAVANQITYNRPRIPLLSNVTGTRADESIATARYWVNHVRQPVKFAQSIDTLHQEGSDIFLEIGPQPILLGMGRHCLPEDVGIWLPSLRPGQADWQLLLYSLGELYVRGVKVDWQGFDRDYVRSKVVLPTYPFQRQRYWIETDNTDNNLIHKKQFLSNHENLHPLLGQRLHLAGLEEQIRFECQITASQPPYLKHHCVFSQPVFPAAAYLEIALAAGSTLFNSDNLILEDVEIQQALILSKDKIKTIQVILTPQEGQTYSFQIFSLDVDVSESSPRWTLHVEGKLLAGDKNSKLPITDLKTINGEYNHQILPQDFYQKYKDTGLEYGSSFQAVKQLWHSEGKALGQIQLPESLVKEVEKYQLHPVLLDASLQTLAATRDGAKNQELYLPANIKRLQVYRRSISNHLWSQVKTSSITANTKTITGEVSLWDERGIVVAQLEGLTALQTSSSALLRTIGPNINNWLYQIHWQPQSTSPDNQSINLTKPGSWLLFSPPTGVGKHLAESLKQQGQHCILVTPGENYQQLESQHYQINPLKVGEFPRLLQESLEQQPPLRGIVHLWSLQETIAPPTSAQELQKSQELGCGSVLHLVQAIVKNQEIKSTPLWLVTQGSQSVAKESLPIQFQQAPLWGLGRVIAQEHGELQCRCLDLDPTVEDSQVVAALLQELLSPGDENQIAYRQQIRHVARLERQQKALTSIRGGLQFPSQKPFQLKLSEYGLLDNLILQPMERRSPDPQEVEIQVKAVGLNFRDVLNALGLLKDYYAQNLGITSAEQLTFGFECAGTIVAIGEGVSHLEVGTEVMVNLLPDAFSSFITTRAEVVVPKPQPISPAEAATIPLAFSTAYHGLHNLAKIQPGDRVLIHAAAGGVGQAAVQLAQIAGAEVFATASPPKWEFLKSMGVKHVMNSRTLDFAEEVMNLTQGKGVDVVLNSLNGEFITKSFEALAAGGRFVEIGKIGIWDESQVKQKRPDAEYFPFDLGEVAQENPSLIAQIMNYLGQQFEQGCLKPLPHKVFDVEQVVEAFRYMQQGKHIGKVVVSMPQAYEKPASIQAEGSYLITGGLGALGLNTAKWMAEQGARHLVLTGRRQPSEKAQQTIEELQEAGAQVLVLCGDISQAEDVARIIEKIEVSLPPLRGVIHAAGVLDDGLLSNMSWEQFTRVMAPKVQGAWHLHYLTENLPLDFFVCFSSIASLLGSPGQGNYVAANAFMDALAHYRRGMGLPGLSINWGPWAEGGMAANLGSQHQNRMLTQGMSPISHEGGLQILADLLAQDSTQVGVLPINWSKFLKQLPVGTKMPLLDAFTSTLRQSKKEKSDFIQRLEVTPVEERRELLVTHVRKQVARVLGLTGPEQIELRQSLFDLGIDSLMAVELRNHLQSSLGHSIDSTVLFDYPTLDKLVDYLGSDVLSMELSTSSDFKLQVAEQETHSSDRLKERLKEMSQDEIANLFAQELNNLKEENRQ
jgi:myxalamid-type polyketide synthase MxaB